MNYIKRTCFLMLGLAVQGARAESNIEAKVPYPKVNKDTWVMVEIWPEVKDITFSAFFLDFSFEKNKNLCDSAKRIFDRDQESQSKKAGKDFTSRRLCLSLGDAVNQKYVRSK